MALCQLQNHLRIIAGELILLCYALGFLLILLGEKFRDLFKWRRKKPRPKSRSGEESAVKSNRREMLCVPPQCLADPSLGRHTYIKIGNNKYHYVESGSMGSPRVVLCLHDFADFWYGFRHQLRGLSPIAWVIALDLKGFGDSDKPPEMKEYAMEAIVSELKTFIQMLEHDRVVLVGHGIGGLIGWHLVDQCPHLIEKFVCLATPHPKTFRDKMSKNWRSMKKHRNWFLYRLPGFPDRELAKSGLDIFTSRMGRKTYTSLVTFSNMDLEAYKYSFSRESDWTGPLNYIRNFPSHRYIPLGMSGKMLQTPTLFIIGSIDTETELETICQSSEHVEKFAMKIIDEAGHAPHQEQPLLVNKHIEKFITDDPSGGSSVSMVNTRRKSIFESLYRHSVDGVSNTVGRVSNGVGRVSSSVTGTVHGVGSKILVSSSPNLVRSAWSMPLVSGLGKSFSLESLSVGLEKDEEQLISAETAGIAHRKFLSWRRRTNE